MRKWCCTNDLRISIVTVAMAICSVNANMKCNRYELVLKQYKFLPIFDQHLQSYLFCNNTEVHSTKNAPHPSPPVKNALLSPQRASCQPGNKRIHKICSISFNLLPKLLGPKEGATKITFGGLSSRTNTLF